MEGIKVMTSVWHTFLNVLADWPTVSKDRAGAKVYGEDTRRRMWASPLFIRLPFMCVGLMTGGGTLYEGSVIKKQVIKEATINDCLATEDSVLITTEAGELIDVR